MFCICPSITYWCVLLSRGRLSGNNYWPQWKLQGLKRHWRPKGGSWWSKKCFAVSTSASIIISPLRSPWPPYSTFCNVFCFFSLCTSNLQSETVIKMAPVIVIAHIECKVCYCFSQLLFVVNWLFGKPGSASTVKAMLESLKKDTHSKEGHRQKLYDPVQDIENGESSKV